QPHNTETALLVVANPHALHTPRLLEAAESGYRFAICEKPAAVDLDQLEALEGLPVATWICHGYRLLWGPQELKAAIEAGRFGKLISIEGRYWQSSATRRPARASWKDSAELGGRFDVLLDLATHWADLVTHIYGRLPEKTSVRRRFVNAASPHRDTHLHLTMEFGDVVSFGSVSKTVHGAGNTLELVILGESTSASWSFSNPDIITWGEGATRSTQVRSAAELPARPAPFHGLGWMEGYGRIVEEVVQQVRGRRTAEAPTLDDHRRVLRCLLEAADRESDG
ncbi:MAG: Gfo/Idh/MocA family oxidoreductase, partial [Acidobacteriota bacterium]|nr:Gfo/Idh/MocA family oxidoreductase [Acidobacteriota bacterium]